ncbi:MAG: sulfatase [Verrucomicrobiaceae bacterium]
MFRSQISNLLFALFLQSSSSLFAAQSSSTPNVVFILADDLGWADTTLYGHTKLYRTPNIERLAKRGMTFTRAYSASPLCSPTRSSILTGLNPARTGLTTPNCHIGTPILTATEGTTSAPKNKAIQPNPVNRLDTRYYTLGESFKDAGYATAHFGKWHLGAEPHSPLKNGFDIDIPHWHGPGPAGNFVAPWRYPDFDPNHPKEHIEDRMAEEAVAFMEKNKDKPFLLNYWMFSVHAPFDAKEEVIEKYRPLIDPNDPQRSPTYAAMVEAMDDAIGTLIDALDRLKLTDNTIIVFFSDNGGNMYNEVDGTTPTSNFPLRGGKASMFEGGVRVPMIVAWPGHIQPETRSDALVQSTDFFPTFLDLLPLKKEEGQEFDGVSLAPALRGEPFSREAIFTYFPHDPPVPDWIPPSISVHHEHWKLIREFFQGEDGAHRYRLFNLKEDIGEKNNLASQNPEVVQKLDALITHFLTATNAVQPVPNPKFDPAKYQPELEGKNRVRQPKAATPNKGAAKDDAFDPTLKGWKARNSQTAIKDGILTIKGTAPDPFLGIGVTQHKGPSKITLRILAPKGGNGKVSWSNGKPPIGSTPFTLEAGKWNDLSIDLPATGSLGILRIHLPATGQTVRIDSISISSQGPAKTQNWKF